MTERKILITEEAIYCSCSWLNGINDHNLRHLFFDLLCEVNLEEGKIWKGFPLGIGEIVTSIDELSYKTGLSSMKVRTVLKHLEGSNLIERRKISNRTLIKVLNISDYVEA